MRITLKPGEFRFGISDLGVVIGIQPIIKIGDRKYSGADITTQWSADVNNRTGKIDEVHLEIEWLQFAENIIIPFNMLDSFERNLARVIGKNKRFFFVDINKADELGHGISTGLFVQVTKNQILDWLEIEDKGGSIKNWRQNAQD